MAKIQKQKWTNAEIKKHTNKILELVEQFRKKNKEENFTGITKEELDKKFKRINSPMIVSQSWGGTTPGGNINYNVGIYNPDPTLAIWLFVHVFVGSGNVDPVTGSFLSNIDTRFPRLTQTAPTGFSLAPGDSTVLNFTLKVPATVEKTGYIGNSCLMQVNWHDIGTYLDRGVFIFAVN